MAAKHHLHFFHQRDRYLMKVLETSSLRIHPGPVCQNGGKAVALLRPQVGKTT